MKGAVKRRALAMWTGCARRLRALPSPRPRATGAHVRRLSKSIRADSLGFLPTRPAAPRRDGLSLRSARRSRDHLANRLYGGMHLTPVATTCSVRRPWRVTRTRFRSLRAASRARKHVGGTSPGCDGRRGSRARGATARRPGGRRGGSSAARPAIIKRPSLPARSSRTAICRSGRGSGRCGGSPARRPARAPWGFSASWGSGAIELHGLSCRSCGVRWSAPGGTGSRGAWRWMSRTSVAKKKACAGGRPRRRPSS